MDRIRNVEGMEATRKKDSSWLDLNLNTLLLRATYPQEMLRERESERALQKNIPNLDKEVKTMVKWDKKE